MQVQDDKPYDDINITPMLDLAYVLLVIFILMCTASVQGLRASLPKASTLPSKPKDAPKSLAITINDDGKISVDKDRNPISLAQLEQAAGQFKSQSPDGSVVVKGDTRTHYESVMEVLDVLGKLGISKVGLATKPRGTK
jgi:biopolymer transport protein ExbD